MNSTVINIEKFEGSTSSFESTLGINTDIFRDSIQSGLSLYKNTNKFHPVTAAGSRAWEEIVATLRELVVGRHEHWQAHQQNGMPIIINAKLGVTIVVTSGDENTGRNNHTLPKTRNAKGDVTQNFVWRNFDLFGNDPVSIEPSIDTHQTWVLLYTFDKNTSEVRYELSLPTNTSISGSKGKIKICDWQNRVIFPAISFNDNVVVDIPQKFTDDSDFFDVVKNKK